MCHTKHYSTGASYKAVGKPSMAFYNEALRLINLQKPGVKFSDITIISDDAKGDLVGAKELGMKTVLVLSGKVSDVAKTGVKENMIDQIYKDVQNYIKVINA